jgi:flagellar basal-body rod protein FlgB
LHLSGIMFQSVGANFERYMTLVSDRQKLVASNIANVDTPGYKTKDIDFHSEFENAADGQSPAVIEPQLPVKADGNNVNLDREARLL